MNKIFISDLHLDETHPHIAHIFLNFLHHQTKQTKALYILGDFFETWIGDDDLSPFNQTIIHALRKATEKGLMIYILHGNRDFLLGSTFFKMTGCYFLPDESVIDLFGTPTLLMHGDTLCTADVKYLKFRKKTRYWLVQKLFLLKSLQKRRMIAALYREKSKLHTRNAPESIMDVTHSEVEKIMLKHHTQHLIHGHTHRKAVHSFKLNNKPATRTVLAAWHTQGSALICESTGCKEWIELT